MNTNYKSLKTFSEVWWEQVIAAWNTSEYKPSLANFGLSGFEVLDVSSGIIWIYWNHLGDAEIRASGDSTALLFSASENNWREFIEGKFTATVGVMQQRIIFKGSTDKILPYTLAFNNLARVSRDVLESFD